MIGAALLYVAGGIGTLFALEELWGPAPVITRGGRDALVFAGIIVGFWPIWLVYALVLEVAGVKDDKEDE